MTTPFGRTVGNITTSTFYPGVTTPIPTVQPGLVAKRLATRCFDVKLSVQGDVHMTTLISILEAQDKLAELIHDLHQGEEVVITENDQPVARLLPAVSEPQRKPRQPGMLRGTVLYMAADFDAPLDDFKEYTE